MPYTDRPTGPPAARVKQEYIMSTTVDDLSYTPSAEEMSRDAAQFVDTGRRSWKTLKGKGEAVWPPILEAALLEALEKYQPEAVGSKSDKSFGRFPMRNRFISDYVYETTGKRRTPKQVGSRLQQLRDTCKKDKILQLISHRSIGDAGSSSQSEGSVGASPSPPPELRHSVPVEQEDHTYVKILLQDDLWPAPPPTVQLLSTDSNHPQSIQLSPTPNPPSGTISQNKFNILPYLSGTIEFPSSCALLSQSGFFVYAEGSTLPIHSEVAPLKCISSPAQRSGWLYSVDLVPSFWECLCGSRDVTRYTIMQTLKPAHPSPLNEFSSADRSISVFYKFEAAQSRPQKSASSHFPPHPLIYPGSTNSQAISMVSHTSLPQQGYPQWQPPMQPNNVDAGWTQHMAPPHYPNRFDNPLAPQPQAASRLISSDVPYQGHRMPSMLNEATSSGLRLPGNYYSVNQDSQSHFYGSGQASHSQQFGYP